MEDDNLDFGLEDWTKLKVESAKVLLDHSEKYLAETIKAADKLTARSVTLLKFFVPLLITQLIYLSSYLSSENNSFGILFQLAIYGSVLCIIIIYQSIIAYHLYPVQPLGNSPKNILKNEYVNHKNQELLFVFNCLRTTQRSIDFNQNNNYKRIKKVKFILNIIKIGLAIPLVYVIAWIVFTRYL